MENYWELHFCDDFNPIHKNSSNLNNTENFLYQIFSVKILESEKILSLQLIFLPSQFSRKSVMNQMSDDSK